MKRLAIVAMALFSLGLVVGCSGDEESADPTTTSGPDTTTPKILTFSDPALPIAVVRGQEFAIRVEANASTGFTWSVTSPPDPELVELLTPNGNTEAPSAGGVGAAGSTIFEFKARASGSTEVTLTYDRSFEPSDDPTSETFTINVS